MFYSTVTCFHALSSLKAQGGLWVLTHGCENSKACCVMRWGSWRDDLKVCQGRMLNVSNIRSGGGMNA